MDWDPQSSLAMVRYLQRLGLSVNFIAMDAHFAELAASTMSMLRTVWVPSLGQYVAGTAMVGGGAIAAGALPVIFQAGVFVALGAPYYQARELAKEQNTKAGFAQGFVMGVLNWEWGHAASRFARRYLRINPNDPEMDRIRVVSYNAGLKSGFAAGAALPEDTRKQFRSKFRELAGRADSGSWSKNADAARVEQIDYVIALAGAGLKHKLIKE